MQCQDKSTRLVRGPQAYLGYYRELKICYN